MLRCKGMCSGGVPAAAPPSRKERRMSAAMAVAPVLVHQGIREHRSGRLEAAAALYGRALRADPFDADALHLLGLLNLQPGDPVAAVPFAAKAVLVEPARSEEHTSELQSLM